MAALEDVTIRFNERHRDLDGIFRRHAAELADRLNPEAEISEDRLVLLGAAFTSEYAIEGAALCNPSIVLHPDQTGISPGGARFIMSVRGGQGEVTLVDRVPDRRHLRDGPAQTR